MKKYKSIGKLLAVSFLTAAIASACTEDAMDKINENIEKMCNIYKTINFYNKASNSGNVT